MVTNVETLTVAESEALVRLIYSFRDEIDSCRPHLQSSKPTLLVAQATIEVAALLICGCMKCDECDEAALRERLQSHLNAGIEKFLKGEIELRGFADN